MTDAIQSTADLLRVRDVLEHLSFANMVPHPPEEADVRDIVARQATRGLDALAALDKAVREAQPSPAGGTAKTGEAG